jgi:hypothetical protein
VRRRACVLSQEINHLLNVERFTAFHDGLAGSCRDALRFFC